MKKINILISTFFGNGYISKIPGTFTSLSTLIILYVIFEVLNFKDLNYILILYSIIFFYSFYAVMDSETEFENKDPRQIVIDEVLGQAMPLILIVYLSSSNLVYLIRFLLLNVQYRHLLYYSIPSIWICYPPFLFLIYLSNCYFVF